MRTRNEFEARIDELEKAYQDKDDRAYYRSDRSGSAGYDSSNESRNPKSLSVFAGLVIVPLLTVCFNNLAFGVTPQAVSSLPVPFTLPSLPPFFAPPSPSPSLVTMFPSTAEVHQRMQSGNVNVSKSTITGIVDSESQTASLYWTLVLKNNDNQGKEASLVVDLPENSALSRATLWVNGVAQEAAFSSNSLVEAAYDSLVVERRDPLLVTQVAPNRIRILAAPVPANGGEMKLRVGMTVPCQPGEGGKSSVGMPHISESNLKFDAQQDIHLTSSTPIAGAGSTVQSGIYILKANLPASQMNSVKVNLGSAPEDSFAARLTHTNPAEYVQASTANGKLVLKRVKAKPECKIIEDNDVAFRLSNLWAHQEIESLVARGKVNEACDLANVYRIVSSVSGATVLEQDWHYSNSGLNRDFYRTIGGHRPASSGQNFTGAQTQMGGSSNAPTLMGATNGTIGPQGADATVLQGVNTAGTVRVNSLANLDALVDLVAKTLSSILLAFSVFLGSEALLNKGLRWPVRWSERKTMVIGLIFAATAVLGPNALFWCVRELLTAF